MIDYTLGFAFEENRRAVLLIHKARPVNQAGLWNGIGGHVGLAETPVDAMRREALEEAGIVVPWEPVVRLEAPERYRVHVFRSITAVVEYAATLTDEPVRLWDLQTALHGLAIAPDLHWLIPLALDDSTRAGTLTLL